MIVDVTADGVSLRGHREFESFHVEAAEGVDVAEALTVAGAGRLAGEDAFVSIRWIRGVMAEREDDDEAWQSGFEAMLGFARAQGFLDADGDGIRAHIEPLVE